MVKDILAFADDSLVSEPRFALLATLARRFEARLSAVHILPNAYAYVPMDAGPAVVEIIQTQQEADRKAASSIEAHYRNRCMASGLEGEWHLVNDWYDGVAFAGRHDLVVTGQSTTGLPVVSTVRPEDVALAVGRPTLVIPAKGRFESSGERVIIAWKPTKEAGRAVHDALPLISENAVVTIVEVSDGDPTDAARRSGSDDLRRHLARHGIKATVETVKGADSAAGEIILSRATALKADLIVMGAYGHSRLRELILGGVTRTVLRDMTIPVLMSH
jgi:nucleotide-binding universal stress UspA family protein